MERDSVKKIPTLFVRDFEHDNGRYVTEEVTPGCEWVLSGQGVPTRKYDGTCVRLDSSGAWWARREVKPGKSAPSGYVAEEHDNTTGKTVGWEPIAQAPFAKFHTEAVANLDRPPLPGTYELVGPKVNGNPEQVDGHRLIRHDDAERLYLQLALTFDSIREDVLALAADEGCEGIVWHHPDGRMAKIKARDFRHGA
jgi:hypothetical protein